MRRYLIVAAAAAVALGLSVGSASAAPAPKAYTNCTALNKVYPNGVAKTKKAAVKAVKNGAKRPAVSKKVYLLNIKSDRDRDLVACEKSA